MNYVFKNKNEAWEALRLYTFKKFEDGIYYRDAVLETNENIKVNLAEMPLANGILRVDKVSSPEPLSIRLGHYALPQFDKDIITKVKKVKGKKVTIIDNGMYQLAIVTLLGWDKAEVVTTQGLHPESKISNVINVEAVKNKSSKIYATLMLWKKSGKDFTNKELMPVCEIESSENTFQFKINKETKTITY